MARGLGEVRAFSAKQVVALGWWSRREGALPPETPEERRGGAAPENSEERCRGAAPENSEERCGGAAPTAPPGHDALDPNSGRNAPKEMGCARGTEPADACIGLICDGAIRSGKSFSMGVGFWVWAMECFDKQQFALCGKTIKSLRRNLISWLVPLMEARGYEVCDLRGDNLLVVRRGKRTNFFYLFGGRDERSQDLIQGITLAGALFDEVQLMPQSFVNQATGRCSIEGSRLFFNCNPGAPNHWFKTEWIDRAREKHLIYLHFTMRDNPSLSQPMRERYQRLYSGVFYRRYVLGEWAQADGSVYPMFERDRHVVRRLPKMRRVWVAVDYGHTNPTVFLLMGEGTDQSLYVMREWYHDGGGSGVISPRGYAAKLAEFLRTRHEGAALPASTPFDGIFVDPSAEGFISQLREDGLPRVRRADNRVLMGIQLVSGLLECGRLKIHQGCAHTLREMASYAWQGGARDRPVKKNDHCMDALRYGAMADSRYWMR